MKPEAVFEVESGLKLIGLRHHGGVGGAHGVVQAVRRFFESYDYFVVPDRAAVSVRRRPALAARDRGHGEWRPITNG